MPVLSSRGGTELRYPRVGAGEPRPDDAPLPYLISGLSLLLGYASSPFSFSSDMVLVKLVLARPIEADPESRKIPTSSCDGDVTASLFSQDQSISLLVEDALTRTDNTGATSEAFGSAQGSL